MTEDEPKYCDQCDKEIVRMVYKHQRLINGDYCSNLCINRELDDLNLTQS